MQETLKEGNSTTHMRFETAAVLLLQRGINTAIRMAPTIKNAWTLQNLIP